GRGELRRGGGAARQHQHARGVAIEPMDEARALLGIEAQCVEQPVQMALGVGAALDGKAVRLVDDDEVVVLVQHGAADHLEVARPGRRRLAARRRRADVAQRRDADDLAGSDAIAGLGALAVDAHLAGAQQPLEAAMAEAREMPAEPAVEPELAVGGGDGNGLNAAHRRYGLSCRGSPHPSGRAAAPPLPEPSLWCSAPMAGDPDPASRARHPMAGDPDGVAVRRPHVMARRPDILVAVPRPISRLPYPARPGGGGIASPGSAGGATLGATAVGPGAGGGGALCGGGAMPCGGGGGVSCGAWALAAAMPARSTIMAAPLRNRALGKLVMESSKILLARL